MWGLFIGMEITYDLRAKDLLQLPKAKTVLNGLNSIVFRGSILWNSIPDELMKSLAQKRTGSSMLTKINFYTKH